MKSAEKPTKSIKRQLIMLMVFATIVVLEISFFNDVNKFLDTSLKLVSTHNAWLMFSTFFIYFPIIIMPFWFLTDAFKDLSNQL